MDILKYSTISNEKTCQLQSFRSHELYNFDIKFIFIQDHIKKLWFLWHETISRSSLMLSPAPRNPFLRAVDIITRTSKWLGAGVAATVPCFFLRPGGETSRSWIKRWSLLQMFYVVVVVRYCAKYLYEFGYHGTWVVLTVYMTESTSYSVTWTSSEIWEGGYCCNHDHIGTGSQGRHHV
jgi:hypothetical protein